MDIEEGLWSILPHPTPHHIVRLFARKGDKMLGDFARSPQEIKKFCDSANGLNIYVAPNPTMSTVGIRHSAVDVTHWSFFFIDVDPVCKCPPQKEDEEFIPCITCQRKEDPYSAMNEAIKIFGGWAGRNLENNFPNLIDSGRGVQLWLRADDRELINDLEKINPFEGPITRKIARKVMGYWLNKLSKRFGTQYGCNIDTSCSDLPRVMRMPGTENTKTGKKSQIIIRQKEPYKWLLPMLIGGIPEEILKEYEHPQRIGYKWQTVFNLLTKAAQDYLLHGKEEPGRHKVAFHTAKSLSELGIERSEAERAIVWANQIKGADNALNDNDIQHALNTAFGGKKDLTSP